MNQNFVIFDYIYCINDFQNHLSHFDRIVTLLLCAKASSCHLYIDYNIKKIIFRIYNTSFYFINQNYIQNRYNN